MDLKQLSYFVCIADSGSISKAAEKLHMTQPPLSFQMKQLEAELGTVLFHRGNRQIELSEAGKKLYERAAVLLNYAESTKQEVMRSASHRVLRVGMTSSTVSLLVPYLSAFAKEHQDVRFEIKDGTTFQMIDLLDSHVLDTAVVRTPASLSHLSFITLSNEGMIAVSDAFTDESPITLNELATEKLSLYRRYYPFLMETFRSHSLSPEIVTLSDDARDALVFAIEGLGTAVFPESMRPMCFDMKVRPIEGRELSTSVLLAWKDDHTLSEAASEFISFVKNAL